MGMIRDASKPVERCNEKFTLAMSGPLKVQIVERARALIADEQHWCRGHLAQDVSGVAVFPTSVNAVKRCGLGAVIAAAYELTHDFDAAHLPWARSPAPTLRPLDAHLRQRRKGPCCGACVVR